MKVSARIIPAIFIFCLVNIAGAFGQGSTLFHNLKPGPDGIGYKTRWLFDYQRNWDNGPRPIRLNIWYPAQTSGKKRMLFERYVLAEPPARNLYKYRNLLRKRDIGDSTHSLEGLFGGSEKLFSLLLRTKTSAVENAAPMSGRFPVIIYSLGQNDYSQENTVLFEYLASNGFVVITVPQIGISPRKATLMIDEELSFETQVRDLQFAWSQIHLLTYADENRVAAAGMSMGGVYSLLFSMRNNNIKLFIGLDPTLVSSGYESFAWKYWNSKYYDEWNFKIPMVVLHRIDSNNKANYSIINRLRFSEREIIKFPGLIHSDFTSFPMYTANTPAVSTDNYALAHRPPQAAVKGYEEICATVLRSLQKYLNNKPDVVITNKTDVIRMNAIKAPNEEEFCSIIEREGLEKALQVFDNVTAKYPGDTIVRLKKINRIGFEYYIDKNYKMAIGAYTLYTKAYPRLADGFENLGEMYFYSGNRKKAAINLKKSLQLDPNNKDAQEMMKKLH